MPVAEWRIKEKDMLPDGLSLVLRFGDKTYSGQANLYAPLVGNQVEYSLQKLYKVLRRKAAMERWPEAADG